METDEILTTKEQDTMRSRKEIEEQLDDLTSNNRPSIATMIEIDALRWVLNDN